MLSIRITEQEFHAMERLLADLLASGCDTCEEITILKIHHRVEQLYRDGKGLRQSEQRLRQLTQSAGER